MSLIAAGIAGAAALGQAIAGGISNRKNRKSQEKINQQQQDFAAEQAEKQRQYAKEDFETTNRYNSPEQQMQRLREAGLNPNLVYGKGAENTATMIRGSQPASINPQAPQNRPIPISSGLGEYIDAELKGAQTDNIKAATEVSKQQKNNMELEAAGKIISNKDADFSYNQKQRLADLVYNRYMADLEGQQISNQVTLNRDEREALITTSNLAKTAQDIATQKLQNSKVPLEKKYLEQQIENLKNEGVVKAFEAQMAKSGVHKNDPFYWRMFNQIMSGDKLTPEETVHAVNAYLKGYKGHGK